MRPRASERENNKETEVAACRCCRKDEKPESRVKKKASLEFEAARSQSGQREEQRVCQMTRAVSGKRERERERVTCGPLSRGENLPLLEFPARASGECIYTGIKMPGYR